MDRIEKRSWLRAACAMLSALLVSMVVLNIARSEQLDMANTRLNATYQKAFYETCELTEAIAANYRKLLVAGDDAQMQLLLGEISREAQGASGNLALLPLGEETVSATIKFINQAEDFAGSISRKLATGGEVTDADYQTMLALSEAAGQFSEGLGELLKRFEQGEALFSAEDFSVTGAESLYPLASEEGSYPVLLYDGPFSDGADAGSYRLLSGRDMISREQAEAKLKDFIPVDEIRFTGESMPEVPCYEFRLRSGEYWINAGVTRQGGEVLYLLPENQADEARLGEEALHAAAENFLRERGYGDVEMSYSSAYGGILTINYAAVQDGIVLYPDLIKIQLSMKDGSVIGLDARNYLKNHVPRVFEEPAITEEEALARVGERLLPLSARLCVIPQNMAEYLCYEIAAADASGDFLVYIDALSGVERELLQVVSAANGTLVI